MGFRGCLAFSGVGDWGLRFRAAGFPVSYCFGVGITPTVHRDLLAGLQVRTLHYRFMASEFWSAGPLGFNQFDARGLL